MRRTPELLEVLPTMTNEGLILKVLTALAPFRLMDEGLRNHREIVLTDLNCIRESWGLDPNLQRNLLMPSGIFCVQDEGDGEKEVPCPALASTLVFPLPSSLPHARPVHSLSPVLPRQAPHSLCGCVRTCCVP